MVASELVSSGYVIPRYRAPDDVTWHHVLHGNVPNHQIDFMYCPEVPQGLLTPTHFSHLARLMKYIEPQTNASHGFAIGNLSRDDTQHEPGHGALGLIFGMRIGGATDHAGRRNPPFAHGILTVDRDLDYASLLEAAATFYRHVMNAGEAHSSTSEFYREYVRTMVERPALAPGVLRRYVEDFNDLPRLLTSKLRWDWVADEESQPKRVVIVHPDDEPFGTIAHAAAKIASMLYRSNVRWTSITTGREADIPGGVSIRFTAERDLTVEDRRGALVRIDNLAEDEAEIARALGAKPRSDGGEQRRYAGWRELYAAQGAPPEADPSAEAASPQGPSVRPGHASSPPAREPAQPRQLGEHGTAIMPLVPAEEAVVRPSGLATPPPEAPPAGWRDAGAAGPPSAPASRGGATNGVAVLPLAPPLSDAGIGIPDEIEVTVDKPPSAAKTWLLVATAVVCVALGIGLILFLPAGAPAEEHLSAPATAPSAAPQAPHPAPRPSAEGRATATPTAQPEGAPKANASATSATEKPTTVQSRDRSTSRPRNETKQVGEKPPVPPPKPPGKNPPCSTDLFTSGTPCLR